MINITVLIGVIFLAVVVVFLKPSKHPLFEPQSLKGRVRYVVDGDSLYIASHKPQVRLWGVDTPERNEWGYNQATAHLEQLALHHKITCEVMAVDKYGRTVARCYLPDGRDIGGEMIRSGHAREMYGFSKGYYSRRK